ncbi:prefoldin subunit 5-like [Symsagittifera roscoffensis]|uniref:prefoldin subunit 5-like n=1 Tax=Symsagittifera roscoffensis TaxID=84072 RepID=UPI00307C874E
MSSKKVSIPNASGDSAAMNKIDFASLDLEQLGVVRQQIVREAELIEHSLSSLKFAQQRFINSHKAVSNGMKAENEGKQILVPLTDSLYVPGKLRNASKVLIDAGTGYYVEMNSDKACQFLQKRIDFVSEETAKAQGILNQKIDMQNVCQMMIQTKVSQLQEVANMQQQFSKSNVNSVVSK